MNILFANYGDCTSNSLNHIAAFANQLTKIGHDCLVAIPDRPESAEVLEAPLFGVRTFASLLEEPHGFPNRRGADLVHAWTPRENVRQFTMSYLAQLPSARLIVHLEDNEKHLIAAFARKSETELDELSDYELSQLLPAELSHPGRFPHFLRVAHGITHITDRLRETFPHEIPHHLLFPGIDTQAEFTDDAVQTQREELGLAESERLIVYTGSTTFANLADVKCLTLAVRLLNESGVPTRLVRTGHQPAEYKAVLDEVGGAFTNNLGFIARNRLPRLLAAADVLVQPGNADEFNAFRLPSKLPEFLWAGRPTLLPATNIGLLIRNGQEGLLLESSSPEEIAKRCKQVFEDAELAKRLALGASTFARMHFDLSQNTQRLAQFYESLDKRPGVFGDRLPGNTELSVLVDRLDPELGERVRGMATELTAVKAALEAARSETLRHSAGERYNAAKIEEQRHVTENVRSEMSDRLAELTPLVDRLQQEVKDLRDLNEHNERLNRERVDQLRGKLDHIQNSGSWVFTAPFRAMRRAVLDPLLQKEQKTIAPATESAAEIPELTKDVPIDPGLSHCLDEPADWAAIPARGLMRGWVVSQDGREIVQMRILAGEALVEVDLGVARPDVSTLHPGNPHAAYAGFTASYALTPGWTGETVFEALTDDGVWRRFAARHTKVATGDANSLRFDYGEWVQRFDTLTLADSINHRARIEKMLEVDRPVISVLMPVYNTPEVWLVKAIESVRDQFYPNWELCIADDASTEPHVAQILSDYASRDARIKVINRPENGHISAASNSALSAASGEYCALLDHDDELAPHALAEVAYALEANPDLEFIYSDEDKIDEAGHRSDPYFKPDWNPDLLRGQNYTCHLSVFRTDRLRSIGGFRVGFEGSQDWDLTLRATANLSAKQIHHIAKVLYHWRAIPGSTALVIDQKEDYPFIAAEKALRDVLETENQDVELVSVEGRHWRVRYPLPAQPPKVSLIIPTHNGYELLRTCLDSLRSRTHYPNYELMVVDNRSDDPTTLKYLRNLESEGVRVLSYDREFNFSAINNFAAKHASGSVLAFLNNDLEVIHEDWLDEMVSQSLRPEIGAVGAMLYYPDDTVQHAGVILGIGGLNGTPSVAGHAFKDAQRGAEGQRNRLRLVQNYAAVTAACLVVRREVFEQVGGFDDVELAVAFNDIDFCLRVRAAGYRNLWTPFAELYHHESASRGIEDSPDKLERFAGEISTMRKRWGEVLDRDPSYNPNLTAEFEDFSLAVPPRG
ncbi:MAG: hypothetical protein SynsKO_20430 [Synoicihabitans sp.]